MNSSQKKWREKNKIRLNEYNKEWRRKNPERAKELSRRCYIKRTLRQLTIERKLCKRKWKRKLNYIHKMSWMVFEKLLKCQINSIEHINLVSKSNSLQKEEIRLKKKLGIYEE